MNIDESTSDNSPDESGTRRPRRRAATLGVAGGLVAGGAIGLLAAAPVPTGAASSPGAVTAALQDDTGDDGAGDTTPTGEMPAAERLRDSLQELVDEGTITAAQADAVAEHLAGQPAERGPARRHGSRGRAPGMDGDVVAELLGIDAATLRDELRAGASIADVATDHGVDAQVVIDALVDEAAAHVEVSVDSGRLTEDEAADKLARLEERISARVNGERPDRPAPSDDAADGDARGEAEDSEPSDA